MKTAPAPLRLLFPADPPRWAPPGVAAFAAGLLDLQFLGQVVHIDHQHLADAFFLHGDNPQKTFDFSGAPLISLPRAE